MAAHTVRWTQPAIVTATVDVSLDELTAWAIGAGGIRTLVDDDAAAADAAGLRQLLECNVRLRNELLTRWARAHLPR
ncbi:hypothetical protein ACPW96_21510 [Micromonospora sp. DT81.3]|uniref:hypothetical protein n=1 Tax=Micromonospora sp. DT81.3 TaxID=3416523 RepID=UPI003CF9B534